MKIGYKTLLIAAALTNNDKRARSDCRHTTAERDHPVVPSLA